MIHAILKRLIDGIINYYVLVLVLAVGFSAVGLQYAMKLEIESDYSKLLPDDYESVLALEKVRERVGGEGSDVAVGIISPDFEANRRFAEALIPRAFELKRAGYEDPYLATVEFQRETEFLKDNALYFATDDEIETILSFLDDEIEKNSLEVNPFFIDFEDDFEDEADSTDTQSDVEEFRELYDWLVGEEYPVHDDGTSMTLRFFPSGSQTNVRYIKDLYADMEVLIDELDPKSFHPDMQIVLAGRLMHRVVQVEAIREDVAKTFGAGVGAVLVITILFFLYKSYKARHGVEFKWSFLLPEILRLPVLLLIIGLPLAMSLCWTFGMTYLVVGNLNLMTSTLALLLFGLGIDFGIHFYGRYTEERGSGKPINEAMVETFVSTGKAIMIGATTTSIALFVMVFADFRGFSEFGFIAGSGIIFGVISMVFIQPAILVAFEKTPLLDLEASKAKEIVAVTGGRMPFAKSILVFGGIIMVLAIVFINQVKFEYNFNNLDPQYPEYAAKKAIVDGQSSSRIGSNPAYIVADTQEEALNIAAAIRERVATDTTIQTVKDIITLQDRFPLDQYSIENRLDRIAEVRERLQNTFIRESDDPDVERLRRASRTTNQVDINDVPDYLKDLFTDRDGHVGTFVIIYPSVSLSDGRVSMQFAKDVGNIVTEDGNVYHPGSTSIVAADMMRLMLEESPYMIAAVVILVAIVVLGYFQSIPWALLSMLPLIVGMMWMLFILEMAGLKLNFFNIVVLPAMLGIANDDGIHMVHRYQELGKGSIIKVIKTTGEACTIGTLTTMIGFIGLLLSFHPGLRSIGEVAFIGLVTTLFASIILLPALIQVLEDWDIIKH
jgi:uncharacterized protein